MRGYAAIGLHHPKTAINVGSALRAAQCYGGALALMLAAYNAGTQPTL